MAKAPSNSTTTADGTPAETPAKTTPVRKARKPATPKAAPAATGEPAPKPARKPRGPNKPKAVTAAAPVEAKTAPKPATEPAAEKAPSPRAKPAARKAAAPSAKPRATTRKPAATGSKRTGSGKPTAQSTHAAPIQFVADTREKMGDRNFFATVIGGVAAIGAAVAGVLIALQKGSDGTTGAAPKNPAESKPEEKTDAESASDDQTKSTD